MGRSAAVRPPAGLCAAKIGRLRRRQARPEPAEPNWRYFEGDARRQLEADRADHTAAIRGKLMDARADVGNREEWGRRDGEISDLWADDGPSGYQPPSYEPVNPERRTPQTPSDGLI